MHAAVEAFHIPDSNVVSVVHDEAASMMKAGRKMKEEFRLETTACSAHLLQTCIDHAIDSNGPISNLLAKARKLVGHFKHSALASYNCFVCRSIGSEGTTESGAGLSNKVEQRTSHAAAFDKTGTAHLTGFGGPKPARPAPF